MRLGPRALSSLFLVAYGLLAAPMQGEGSSALLVAHLPSAALEPRELAAGVEALTHHLRRQVPGLDLEPVLFRRGRDLESFLRSAEVRRIAVILSDHDSLLRFSQVCEVEPAFRFVRAGKETHRRLVVVHRDLGPTPSMEDLRGKSLSLVEVRDPHRMAVLQHRVFDGLLSPGDWFAALHETPDEHTAAANVLFGKSAAALVVEDNPILVEHLGRTLSQVYVSPPLSLPVLGACHGRTTEGQRRALAAAVRGLARTPEGSRALRSLGIDGLRQIPEGDSPLARGDLLRPPTPRRRPLAVVMPKVRIFAPSRASDVPLEATDLAFWIPVARPLEELPELPIETGAGRPGTPP